MKLEEAIRQTEFRSEAQRAIINLLFTSSYISSAISEITEKVGITRQQFNVLRILRGQHPASASINLIRERLLDRMPDSSRMVDRLAAKGLIAKCMDEADRRAVKVTITKKGLDLLARLDPEVQSSEGLLDKLSAREIRQLNELLDKIRD